MIVALSSTRLALFGAGIAGMGALAALPDSPLPADTHDFVGGLALGMAIALAAIVVVRLVKPLRDRMPDACDTATPALRRRYLREFVPAITGYVIATVLSIALLQHVHATWLRFPVALLPIPPIALAIRAIMRFIRDSDELQRRIELEAVSFACALVSLAYLAGAFLQMARLIDIPSADAMILVFPLICLSYGLAKLAIMRRYA